MINTLRRLISRNLPPDSQRESFLYKEKRAETPKQNIPWLSYGT
jgi:hypothetical protein